MTVRDVEGKLPYTGGKAISIDENKVISLNLRDENNLIIYDEGDDEIYVDLQLPDGIRPLDAFPVGVTTGRVLVADDWDVTGTIVCFKTTSGDNIKLLYADDGKLYIDNGTGTFKQIYLKGEVDALLQALREYIDAQLALKQDKLTAGKGISIDNNNEISNTQPGPIVSSSAPLNPVEGDQWYDTTTDELKTYDGTNWNATGKEYTAGTGIQVGASHFDTQGPAPDGYHIPTDTEWQNLIGILTTTFSLASTGDTLKTYFKMPRAGYISTAGNINDVDNSGDYWSSTVGAGTYGKRVYCGAYNILYNGAYRSAGSSLRCFKDVSVTPDSSWTTLYDGTSIAAGAGVFHNATLGLISVSGDGTTWTTIQDKNLGATQVYNSGDTLSEANCGGYFQRGNNYMFPFTGATTTSSTQVDGSGYGPGNYYSNSTFITGYDWSTVTNANLWGGETNGTRTDSKIYNTGVLSVNGEGGDVIVETFNPSNAGSTGQLLTKTATGYNWATKNTLPSGGSTGDVLRRASTSGSEWAAPEIGISTQNGNMLRTSGKIRIGAAADYQNLTSYDMNTVYITL